METRIARVRPATAADQEFFWEVLRQAMRPYVEATWGWDEADQLARFRASFDPGLRHVIELGEEPIGVLHVDAGGSPVRLINIQLLPAFQRKGIGTALVRSVLSQAGERPVWLQVLKANPARSLYQRLGFRVIGHTDTHWQMVHDTLA